MGDPSSVRVAENRTNFPPFECGLRVSFLVLRRFREKKITHRYKLGGLDGYCRTIEAIRIGKTLKPTDATELLWKNDG